MHCEGGGAHAAFPVAAGFARSLYDCEDPGRQPNRCAIRVFFWAEAIMLEPAAGVGKVGHIGSCTNRFPGRSVRSSVIPLVAVGLI